MAAGAPPGPRELAYSASPDPLAGAEGTASPLPKNPTPALGPYTIIVNPNSLRIYHTTLGPAAGPTCSKILAPALNSSKT